MKSLQEILTELQAVDNTNLDAVVAALAQVQTDLQAQIAAQPVEPTTDPIVSVTTTTQSGVVAEFVPKA